ncbi:MAG: hypothetical protein SFX73_18760 [Kofleriaceae bacterium]|nr:hypothetical protein [Kofleriaceae bacterium]
MKSFAFAIAVLVGACGSKTPSQPTTPPEGSAAPAAALPDVAFEQLDHDQKIQFMKEKVMPEMAAAFQAHDAKEFAEFGCKTCHGPGAEKGEFHMPYDGLPKLGEKEMAKYKKEDIEWMATVIKPKMAALLKEPEYSKDNPNGFGCMHCHTAAAE